MTMTSEPHSAEEVILDYLTGDITPEDANRLEQWVEKSAENTRVFKRMSLLWQESGAGCVSETFDAQKAFQRFKDIHFRKTSFVPRVFRIGLVAASLAIILTVSAVSFLLGSKSVEGKFADTVVESPVGSISRLTLPDGTQVWLNAESTLTYSQGFGVKERVVILSGEGYFEVEKNESVPFVVKTADIDVQVLGTKFNLRDYPQDLEAIVSLQEGRVLLNNKLNVESPKHLFPNQRVVLDKHNGNMHIESKDATNAIQWTMGSLFFDEEYFSDIAKELERMYNVKITIIGDELRHTRIYASFATRDMSIDDILDVLSSTNRLKYTRDHKDIKISPIK